MTSIPASRSARAMTFAPRSCPSRPGFATRTRIFLSLISLHENPERPAAPDVGRELLVAEEVAAVGFERLYDVREARVVEERHALVRDHEVVEVLGREGQRFEALLRGRLPLVVHLTVFRDRLDRLRDLGAEPGVRHLREARERRGLEGVRGLYHVARLQADGEVSLLRVGVRADALLPERDVEDVVTIIVDLVAELRQPRVLAVLGHGGVEDVLNVEERANLLQRGAVGDARDQGVADYGAPALGKLPRELSLPNDDDAPAPNRRAARRRGRRGRLRAHEPREQKDARDESAHKLLERGLFVEAVNVAQRVADFAERRVGAHGLDGRGHRVVAVARGPLQLFERVGDRAAVAA